MDFGLLNENGVVKYNWGKTPVLHSLYHWGSIKKEKVPDKFKSIVEEAERLRDLNDRMQELSNPTLNDEGKIVMERGKPIYNKDELINKVRSTIRNEK